MHTHDWRLPPVDGVLIGLGSVFTPPVRDGVADIVLALNLLDNVADPLAALARLDAMLKPGGLLVVASPFAWRDDITPPLHQLGGGLIPAMAELGSAATLRAFLAGDTPLVPRLKHTILATADVPWRLRDHARCSLTYDVHMIASRKREAAEEA